MARRTIQETLASDPAYSGAFDAKRTADSAVTPIRRPPSPQPPEQQGPSTKANIEVSVEPVEAARLEPSLQPAPEPVATPAPPPPAAPQLIHAAAPTPAPNVTAKVRRTEDLAAPPRTPVSVRLRPLATQAERISASGLNPRQVMKAAWRKATESFTVGPAFVAMSEEERASGATFQFETTLMVDAQALAALAQERDPLGVESPWSLMRGQIEPSFWTELDAILAQLPKPKTSQDGAS